MLAGHLKNLRIAPLAAAVAVCATAVLAAPVNVGGNNPPKCSIVITPTGSSGINLGTSGVDLNVATVREKCNSSPGYVISVTTDNGIADNAASGVFKGDTAGNVGIISYSVKYDGGLLNFANGADANAKSVTGKESGHNSAVEISFTGAPLLDADSYRDVLNFTMTLN